MTQFRRMKLASWFFLLILSLAALGQAQAQSLAVNGVDHNGYIGVYTINDQNYWWMCVEPTGTPAAESGESFLANQLSILGGWDRQNTERQALYAGDTIAQAALNRQVNLIGYVLDTYLPLDTLLNPAMLPAGSESSARYGNNETFYNSMTVVQHFLAEMYGKPQQSDFSDLSNFTDRWSGVDLTDAGLARSALFQSILQDIEGLDPSFIDAYVTQNAYYIANTLFPEADLENWQDALVIVAPVPEPGSALLIGCCGLALLLRRRRLV